MDLNNDTTNTQFNCKQYTCDQFNSCPAFSTNSCSFLHINIRSLAKNYDNLVDFLNILNHNFLFLGLSETWLSSNSSFYNLPNYNLLTCNREKSRGGGVALYVHSSLSFCQINTIQIMHSESIFVETRINNKKIIIGVNYRQPNTSSHEYIDSLEACLDQLSARGDKCVILGDVNIDTSVDSAPATNYQTTLNTYNFSQIISTATRVGSNSSTTIDHLITNITDHFIECGTLLSDISDHYPIFGFIEQFNHVFKDDIYTKYDFKNYNPDAFLADLSAVSWQSIYETTDPSTAYSEFYNKFYNVSSKHVKIKMSRNKTRSGRKPWLTKALLKSINTKHKLFSKMKNNPGNLQNVNAYKSYRNILTKLLKSARKSYYANKFTSSHGDSDKTWQIINEVINKPILKSAPKKITRHDMTPLTCSADISEEFNNYFTNVGPSLASRITRSGDFGQYLRGNQTHSFFFHPVCEEEVLKQIKSLDPNKSAGLDQIHSKIVIHAANVIASPIAHIINCSLSQGIFPDVMKMYKAGSTEEVSNYRPISILPIISKLF